MLSVFSTASRAQSAYRRRFLENRSENLFMGSFTDLIAARAYVPHAAAANGDTAALATFGGLPVQFDDYPALFWISRSLGEGMRHVFDLGGHAAARCAAVRHLLDGPPDLRWTVCQVPGAVSAEAGARAVPGDAAHPFDFCTDAFAASGCDLLYVSGSLPYLPMRLCDILAALPVKPRRVVLNATPVHPERTIYTLNSSGIGVRPCRIQQHDELLAELSDAGYRVRDQWRADGPSIEVPFVEGGAQPYCVGGCFDLA